MTEIRGYSRTKRIYPLTTWDVSFNINADVLNRFLDFLEDIHPDLPLIFYEDKILIRQKSSDNISFVTIYIDILDVMNYDPGLEGENDKVVVIDATDLSGEISGFAKGADMVTVRIDTKKLKKCEFSCGEYRRHKVLLTVPDYFPKLAITEKTVKKNREDRSIKGCNMIIEPETFAKIVALGGKKGGADMMFEVSKKGLLVYTSDEDSESGSSFEMLNESDDSRKDMGSMIGVVDNIDYSNEDDDDSYDAGNDYSDDINNIDNKEIDNVNNSEMDNVSKTDNIGTIVGIDNNPIAEAGISEIDDAWSMPIPHSDMDKNVSKSSNKKNKNKDKPKEKEREEKTNNNTNTTRSKFLLFDMTPSVDSIIVGQKKSLISVMTKLKAQNPILIEIRSNSPLIIEQANAGLWRTTLTIASVLPENDS